MKTIRISKEHYDALTQKGGFMSNWLYNQAQTAKFEVYREDMQKMVREWDAQVSFMHSTYLK